MPPPADGPGAMMAPPSRQPPTAQAPAAPAAIQAPVAPAAVEAPVAPVAAQAPAAPAAIQAPVAPAAVQAPVAPAAVQAPVTPAQAPTSPNQAAAAPGAVAQTAQEAPAEPVITPERRRNFFVREGYSYFLVQIIYTAGIRFGLGVKHYRNQVIVSKVEEGSMVAETMKVLDRICDVNSHPVTDKDVCRTLIVKSLKNNGEVNMIIERPIEPDAITAMENALNASKMQEPSVALAPDVKSILRRYNEKLKHGHGQMQPRKALADPNKGYANAPRVNIDEGETKSKICLIIGSDTTKSQQAQLIKVPPRPSICGPQGN